MWYLIMVLVCVALMVSDVKHLFLCLVTIYMSFAKYMFRSFARLFIGLFGFFCYWIVCVLYISWILAPYPIFFPLCRLLFHFVDSFLCYAKIFIWMWSHLCIFALFAFAAAAAAKSLQSCPTLCDPIDSSPPGSPLPGILQARTLECIAISFSNAWKWKRMPLVSNPKEWLLRLMSMSLLPKFSLRSFQVLHSSPYSFWVDFVYNVR